MLEHLKVVIRTVLVCLLIGILVVAVFFHYKEMSKRRCFTGLPPGATPSSTVACPEGCCDGWVFWRMGKDCFMSIQGKHVPRTCEGDR